MSEIKFRPQASAKKNGDFICIETLSGWGRMGRDPKGKQYLLSPDVSDELLGKAVIDALAHSRHLTLEECGVFFDYETKKTEHAEWVKTLLERYGYKTRRALFKDMEYCGIFRKGETIVFWPLIHKKLELWSRLKSDGIEDVIVPVNSSPSEIGAALRLAFERRTR